MIKDQRARSVLALLPFTLTLIGATPGDDAKPADHVWALAGTWSCRTLEGSLTHQVGTRDGDRLAVTNDVVTANGRRVTLRETYAFEAGANRWAVETGVGTPLAVEGLGTPWTAPVWDVRARDASGRLERIRYELLPDGDYRRSFARPAPGSADDWWLLSAERCRSGEEPPPASACVFATAPADIISLARPSSRDVPMETAYGDVEIKVDLDEHSHVVGAKVIATPSPVLNASALQAARSSIYRTAVHDCTPVRSSIVITLRYGRGR
jgi:hypothetical protein